MTDIPKIIPLHDNFHMKQVNLKTLIVTAK